MNFLDASSDKNKHLLNSADSAANLAPREFSVSKMTDDDVLSLAEANLTALFTAHPNMVDGISSGDTILERIMSLKQKIEQMLEANSFPTRKIVGMFRNQEIIRVGKSPLTDGSLICGIPIEHLPMATNTVLASEFYDGKIANRYVNFRVSVSEITVDPRNGNLMNIVGQTHAGRDAIKKGNVTLIIDGTGDLSRLPARNYDQSVPVSVESLVPIGISASEIMGCIVFNDEDEAETIESVKLFDFPIPVYNKFGRMIYPVTN